LNWDDWKYFLAVARYNSLTRAAVDLQVSTSTVARRIAELEKVLGVALFNRRPNGYWQTRAAQSIFAQVEQSEAKFELIKRTLAEASAVLHETIKIELPELLGQHLLIPALLELQQQRPEIKFDIETRVINSQLSTRASDIVVRLNRPLSGAYTMRKVGELTQSAYSSEAYFAAHQEEIASTGLSQQFLIGWEDTLQYLPLAKWLNQQAPNQPLWLKTSSLNAQLEATAAGLGIAVLPKFAAHKFKLTQIPLHGEPLQAEIWLMRNIESSSTGVDVLLKHIAHTLLVHSENLS
jgi:DNA-binding transcriptional LysR family regulator